MVQFWNNNYTLVATQVLDGTRAGIYDMVIPIVVCNMTEGNGSFGFIYGFVITFWSLGHGLILIIGESVVHASGYTSTFLKHALISIIFVMVISAFVYVKK